MDTERIFKIVLGDISISNMKLEEEIERTINSDMEITLKTSQIKSFLSQMVMNDASIAKFSSLMMNNKNNNDLKQNENE